MSFHERLAAALVAGSTEHYEDAELYDHEYGRRRDDVRWYRALAQKELGKPGGKRAILELGCGSGRTLIPLAKDGWHVVGVDASAKMLARCQARVDRLRGARVDLVGGDFRAIRLGRRFPLVICPFNAFLHLYDRTSVERFLARVRASLTPRGRFVFDVSMPQAEELARKPERAFSTPRFDYPGVGLVRYKERFDYEPLRQILFVSMEFEPVSGAPKFMTPLAHRQFFPAELEALFHYNGFRIDGIEGDFDGPATNESSTLVYTTSARP